MACFTTPSLFFIVLKLGWNNAGMLFGVTTAAGSFTALAVQYRNLLPTLGRLSWVMYSVLLFIRNVYNGITDHTVLRVARDFEAWEAARSQKSCASPPQHSYGTYPLDDARREFRILKIHWRTLRSELRCEFVVASVDNQSLPEAISYTWGGERFRRTSSSTAASSPWLQRLSSCFGTYRWSFWSEVYFWIDAVCINQQNIPERNSQVRLMGDICRLARRTLVWLAHHLDAMDAATVVQSSYFLRNARTPSRSKCTRHHHSNRKRYPMRP